MLDDLLEKAIRIAVLAHYKQRDRGDKPYIYHLLHVMQEMPTTELKIIAVLHDLLEDHPENSTTMLLDKGFTLEIVDAIETLTRRKGETYGDYINRVASNPRARQVKLADLKHNLDTRRLGRPPTADDLRRCSKYAAARCYLLHLEGLSQDQAA